MFAANALVFQFVLAISRLRRGRTSLDHASVARPPPAHAVADHAACCCLPRGWQSHAAAVRSPRRRSLAWPWPGHRARGPAPCRAPGQACATRNAHSRGTPPGRSALAAQMKSLDRHRRRPPSACRKRSPAAVEAHVQVGGWWSSTWQIHASARSRRTPPSRGQPLNAEGLSRSRVRGVAASPAPR